MQCLRQCTATPPLATGCHLDLGQRTPILTATPTLDGSSLLRTSSSWLLMRRRQMPSTIAYKSFHALCSRTTVAFGGASPPTDAATSCSLTTTPPPATPCLPPCCITSPNEEHRESHFDGYVGRRRARGIEFGKERLVQDTHAPRRPPPHGARMGMVRSEHRRESVSGGPPHGAPRLRHCSAMPRLIPHYSYRHRGIRMAFNWLL